MIFYFNLPSSEEVSFENAKQIAIQKINKRSENKFKWTALKDINRNYLYSIVLSEDVNFLKA